MKNYNELIRMDIYAKTGTRVIFDAPDYGYSHHQEIAKKHLVVGKVYTVDSTVVHSSSTDVYLIGFPNIAFNSVSFGQL
jgi:hypothetical protein